MLEKEFLDNIDCKFPYNDIKKAEKLVKTAVLISDNSVFWIIHELVRPPKSMTWKINKTDSIGLLNYIDNNFWHPLKTDILSISKRVIENDAFNEEEILLVMNQLKDYKWLHTALNILYFICDDFDWKIEEKYNEIILHWDTV